jgi:hypothetical protein
MIKKWRESIQMVVLQPERGCLEVEIWIREKGGSRLRLGREGKVWRIIRLVRGIMRRGRQREIKWFLEGNK